MGSHTTAGSANGESELVIRAQHGDRKAFDELVCIHAQPVMNVIYRMCGNVQVAEDAAQETFVQAWLHLSSYRTQTSLRNWLYRIGVNAATDILRKEKRILPNDIENMHLPDARPGPEVLLTQTERMAWIHRTILALPELSRAVLVLREYEELSYHEIAETLDIPMGTVMSRLNYARKVLREKLEQSMLIQVEAEHVTSR
jgi:RNA polymerase sigma-70 factor (ECF subfamily)